MIKVLSSDFCVPGMFIFRYLKYPRNRALLKEGIEICEPPLHLLILKVFTSYYWGKEILEKIILVLKKTLTFFQKILFEPCRCMRDFSFYNK